MTCVVPVLTHILLSLEITNESVQILLLYVQSTRLKYIHIIPFHKALHFAHLMMEKLLFLYIIHINIIHSGTFVTLCNLF